MHAQKIEKHDGDIAELEKAMAVMQVQMQALIKAQDSATAQMMHLSQSVTTLTGRFDAAFNRGWGFTVAMMFFIVLAGGISGVGANILMSLAKTAP